MPQKTWVIGEEVLATDFNTYVQEQVVATFPTAAARDAAILTPQTGQTCTVAGTFQVFRGGSWQTDIQATSGTLPTGVPAGTVVWLTDVKRPVVWDGTVWRTMGPTTRVYGVSVAANPVPTAGQLVIPQTNFTMPATGLVTMTYQLSVAQVSGTNGTWEAVIEGTGFTNAGVCRAYFGTGMTGLFLAGTHTFELAAGARFGRVLLKRVAGDLGVQSFGSAYGIEITY